MRKIIRQTAGKEIQPTGAESNTLRGGNARKIWRKYEKTFNFTFGRRNSYVWSKCAEFTGNTKRKKDGCLLFQRDRDYAAARKNSGFGFGRGLARNCSGAKIFCVKENNDNKSRPAIANSIDLSGYGNVIIAYPIWWGLAPKIVYTFVEQNDLNGKNLVTLCTSGGSGLGRSGSDLAKHAKGAVLKGGREFRESASGAEVKKYIDSILK